MKRELRLNVLPLVGVLAVGAASCGGGTSSSGGSGSGTGTNPTPIDRYYVATTGSDTTDCHDQSNPCLTIQYAVGQSKTDGEIAIASGFYTGDVSIDKA